MVLWSKLVLGARRNIKMITRMKWRLRRSPRNNRRNLKISLKMSMKRKKCRSKQKVANAAKRTGSVKTTILMRTIHR
jgi:hypothetical protein